MGKCKLDTVANYPRPSTFRRFVIVTIFFGRGWNWKRKIVISLVKREIIISLVCFQESSSVGEGWPNNWLKCWDMISERLLNFINSVISLIPAGNYMFRVNNRNTSVSIVNFEQVNAGRDSCIHCNYTFYFF